ncbi:unnamed protein product [Thelazia callipaeda]|uniref:Nucleotid_trans domain-containing protein n=1 Tax=Thelazia callipaeda TaxID=103827 RepID=A0A0N5CRF5_THECL|nr:unnamed protein product [Thelazia callipaeda]
MALAEISGTPAILILNSHALNLTLNWLCNVKTFASVHDRLIIFAFDYVAFDAISKLWPKIKVLLWPLPEMDVKFKSGDAHYQVFMYWRANLSAYLASIKRDFWMFQTDTLWRKNIFEVISEFEQKIKVCFVWIKFDCNGSLDTDKLLGTNGNLLFDQEGDQGLLDGMVAGGYFFVKGDTRSECFFTEVARQLKNYYATDNNIMTALCAISYCNNHCYFIPIRFVRFKTKVKVSTE